MFTKPGCFYAARQGGGGEIVVGGNPSRALHKTLPRKAERPTNVYIFFFFFISATRAFSSLLYVVLRAFFPPAEQERDTGKKEGGLRFLPE